MNELIPITEKAISNESVQTVNARELHAFLQSKQDYSTWIKSRIEQFGFVENVDFIRFHKKMEANNATLTEYFLTLDMGKELSMVERNDKGKQARKYFIDCEKQLLQKTQQLVLPDFSNPAIAARAWAEQYEQRQALEQQAKIDAPKIAFFNDVAGSKDLIDVGAVAKVLNLKGIGRNKLFAILREIKVLQGNNQPYQKYVDLGWFKVVESKYQKPNGDICINLKTMVYQKGINGIRRKALAQLEVSA